MRADINCDMGESFGLYTMGDDAALMPLITVANVACGFHGSDFNHMRTTCRLAKEHGVKVGAHPSLPDLQGFGRRQMAMEREELANCIIYQVGALAGFLKAEGMEMSHIKPHGALYGMAAREEHVAHAVADAAEVFGVPLMGMIGTLHETVYPARRLASSQSFTPTSTITTRAWSSSCATVAHSTPSGPLRAASARHRGGPHRDRLRQGRGGARRCHLRPLRHAECPRDRERGERAVTPYLDAA